jgi:hypothetical protein
LSHPKSLKKPSVALLCFKSQPPSHQELPLTKPSTKRMLYTCYDYHSNRNPDCLIFMTDKGIINVYDNPTYDYAHRLFVMTEEKMKEYPVLYEKYKISMMLTEDATKLSEDEHGYYISKKTIWKNLYITQTYNSESYMSQYPSMCYKLSEDSHIRDNMHIIEDIVMIRERLINNDMINRLILNESKSIDEDLCDIEREIKKMKVVSQYIPKIVPENFPEDLKNTILSHIYVF